MAPKKLLPADPCNYVPQIVAAAFIAKDPGKIRVLTNIQACGVKLEQIEYLLITHCHFDHTGSAKAFKDLIHFRIVAHELEAPFLEQGDNVGTAANWYGAKNQPFHVDLNFSGSQEKISLGGRIIKAIHTPGHSPGSMVFLTESEEMKVLFG